MMQNLTLLEAKRVEEILKTDRQWSRYCRIGHARRMLRLANEKYPQTIPVWRAVLRRLNYDYIDKAMANVR